MVSSTFANKANSHSSSGNTFITTIMPFWPLRCKSEAIFSEKVCPGDRAGVFLWENFHPSYKDLGRKRGQPSLLNEHINILQRKKWRDFGNRASPVDRAHMKRPYKRKLPFAFSVRQYTPRTCNNTLCHISTLGITREWCRYKLE